MAGRVQAHTAGDGTRATKQHEDPDEKVDGLGARPACLLEEGCADHGVGARLDQVRPHQLGPSEDSFKNC